MAELKSRNTKLEEEAWAYRQREDALRARELEITRRESEFNGRQLALWQRISVPGAGAVMQPHATTVTSAGLESNGLMPSAQPLSALPSAMEEPPVVVPQKRTLEANSNEDDEVEIFVGPHSMSGIALIPRPVDPLRSSVGVMPGAPDPSVEGQPESDWYRWFKGSTTVDVMDGPMSDANTTTGPPRISFNLPDWVPEVMGDDAEERERHRFARISKRARPPAPIPRNDGDCGPWETVTIVTVHQAHNLRHWAVTHRNVQAARYYRRLNAVIQHAVGYRSEGLRYLMRTFPLDVKHFPSSTSSTNHVGEPSASMTPSTLRTTESAMGSCQAVDDASLAE